jgi:geranylgeranyl pyrophosphate synthase
VSWLQALYPAVREIIWDSAPADWPELKHALVNLLDGPMIPEAALPLASCRAVGGNARDALHVAAAVVAAATGLRLLDDVADQDRRDRLWSYIGPARALNFASAMQVMAFEILDRAPIEARVLQRINRCFIDTFLTIASGQDRDLSGRTRTVEEYWATVERKIACGYAASCASGAMVGTADAGMVALCHDFGYHLGFAMQIINDLQSIWSPNGATDLEQGKVTLPLVYGLSFVHPGRRELEGYLSGDEVGAHSQRIREILEQIEAREFLVWAALQEREQALDSLSACPDSEGREALEAYITGLFGDIDLPSPIESTT